LLRYWVVVAPVLPALVTIVERDGHSFEGIIHYHHRARLDNIGAIPGSVERIALGIEVISPARIEHGDADRGSLLPKAGKERLLEPGLHLRIVIADDPGQLASWLFRGRWSRAGPTKRFGARGTTGEKCRGARRTQVQVAASRHAHGHATSKSCRCALPHS